MAMVKSVLRNVRGFGILFYTFSPTSSYCSLSPLSFLPFSCLYSETMSSSHLTTVVPCTFRRAPREAEGVHVSLFQSVSSFASKEGPRLTCSEPSQPGRSPDLPFFFVLDCRHACTAVFGISSRNACSLHRAPASILFHRLLRLRPDDDGPECSASSVPKAQNVRRNVRV